MPQEILPQTARAISLLLSNNPAIQDAHPGVLHQLLEFSHRYTHNVLSDALVYAEHAGRAGKLEMEDVMLGVQARVGWELGGRTPKEYILSLATQVNATPLPAVPEVFGVRLPPEKDRLAAVDFDLIPNKPPPGVRLFEEEVIEETDEEEEIGEEEEDEDDEMEEVAATANGVEEGGDEDGLFDGDDDEDLREDVSMGGTSEPPAVTRTLVEDDDYD